MATDFDYDSLRRVARMRVIRIDANGVLTVHPLPHSEVADDLALDVQVDSAYPTLAGPCQAFEATTLPIAVPLALNEAAPMINPERWGEFSSIQTSRPVKHVVRAGIDWSGTIEERVRVKFGPVVTDYHNRLKIDFRIETDRARVDFELDECFQGDLASEKGFFVIEPHPQLPGMVTLVSKKALLYQPPSPWCSLPAPVLTGILEAWLTAATAEYALRMALGAARP